MNGWLGLDIGGAQLKLSDGGQLARSLPFALWQQPDELPRAVQKLVAGAPCDWPWAVTMTGELADCFDTKEEGVRRIVESVRQAAGSRTVLVYLTDGSLVAPDEAVRRPWEAAASNWHILARYAGSLLSGSCGLLIDIGSTTTDIIPLVNSQPSARGTTDPERLQQGELVYSGVVRTPLFGLVPWLPYRGATVRTAKELFATTGDAYLWLGQLPEAPDRCDTADGRPATRTSARARLARLICSDRSRFDDADATMAAEAIAAAQRSELQRAIDQVAASMPSPPVAVVVSGQGEFLARQTLIERRFAGSVISLAEQIGTGPSHVAPAFALARWASQSKPLVSATSAAWSAPRASLDAVTTCRVVKVGGSLFGQPDLAVWLGDWLAAQPNLPTLFIAGGGQWAEQVRRCDQLYRLGEERSHRLCLRLLTATAEILASLLPEAELVTIGEHGQIISSRGGGLAPAQSPTNFGIIGRSAPRWICDPRQFVTQGEAQHAADWLPASWEVTTDSIAARLAAAVQAAELVLLKSCRPPGRGIQLAAECGYVDRYFPRAAANVTRVRCVALCQPGFPEEILASSFR